MVLNDTHPRISAKQIELIRGLSPERKLELTFAFSWELIQASRQALAEQYPNDSEQEIMLRWAEIHYGTELIDRVRRFLKDRQTPTA